MIEKLRPHLRGPFREGLWDIGGPSSYKHDEDYSLAELEDDTSLEDHFRRMLEDLPKKKRKKIREMIKASIPQPPKTKKSETKVKPKPQASVPKIDTEVKVPAPTPLPKINASVPDLSKISSKPTFVKSASTPGGEVYYRLTFDEVPKEDFARELLLSIDLRDIKSLFQIGRREEEIYVHVSRKMTDFLFGERDTLKSIQSRLKEVADRVNRNQFKKALEASGCSSLTNYLDITKNDFEIQIGELHKTLESYESLKAVSQAGQACLRTVVDTLEKGCDLFENKVPISEKVLLTGLKDRFVSLKALLGDFNNQVAQIDVTSQGVQGEMKVYHESITGIISQLHQYNAMESLDHKDTGASAQRKDEWTTERGFMGSVLSIFKS